MTNGYDLPDEKIYKLREEEGMTFKRITEELSLPCHYDTTRRHYYKYKERNIPFEPDENKNFWDKVKEFFKRN